VGSASPVAAVDFDLEVALFTEHNLGNLCADAARTFASGALVYTADPTPADVAVIPNGVIRDPIRAGNNNVASFADIYNVLPLGMTPDPVNQTAPGWPLISVYVTDAELREIAEVAISGSSMANDNSLYLNFAGMRFNADIGGPFMANVRQVYLCGNTIPPGDGGDGDVFSSTCNNLIVDLDDAGWTSDPNTLYRLVVDLYTALLVGKAAALGFNIAPQKADGTPVDMGSLADLLSLRVDADPATAGIQELKGWQALLQFVTHPGILNGTIEGTVYDTGGIGMGRVTEL
jgi:5'-nucleotidase